MLKIKEASHNENNVIAALAKEIWHEHYTAIIGTEQINYMLELIQSENAIQKQIESGMKYYLFEYEGTYCGYLAFKFETLNKAFLSKLYIKNGYRGKGAIKLALNTIKELGANQIYLTVNRENYNSIEAYQHRGFDIVKEEKADIGHGYIMDDYIMEWNCV